MAGRFDNCSAFGTIFKLQSVVFFRIKMERFYGPEVLEPQSAPVVEATAGGFG
jgi:hypothetical protein